MGVIPSRDCSVLRSCSCGASLSIRARLTEKAYAKFWKEVDSLDLACKKKELALAQKEYSDVLAALKEFSATI